MCFLKAVWQLFLTPISDSQAGGCWDVLAVCSQILLATIRNAGCANKLWLLQAFQTGTAGAEVNMPQGCEKSFHRALICFFQHLHWLLS